MTPDPALAGSNNSGEHTFHGPFTLVRTLQKNSIIFLYILNKKQIDFFYFKTPRYFSFTVYQISRNLTQPWRHALAGPVTPGYDGFLIWFWINVRCCFFSHANTRRLCDFMKLY